MASYARRFILHNVRLVGGCCGTTPEHIRQMKAAVRAMTTTPTGAPTSAQNFGGPGVARFASGGGKALAERPLVALTVRPRDNQPSLLPHLRA